MNVNVFFTAYHFRYSEPLVHNLVGTFWISYVVVPANEHDD